MADTLKVDGKEVHHFAKYVDGFSFTVPTELEAYKAAYIYKHSRNVVVRFAPGVQEWLVQVYNNDVG